MLSNSASLWAHDRRLVAIEELEAIESGDLSLACKPEHIDSTPYWIARLKQEIAQLERLIACEKPNG